MNLSSKKNSEASHQNVKEIGISFFLNVRRMNCFFFVFLVGKPQKCENSTSFAFSNHRFSKPIQRSINAIFLRSSQASIKFNVIRLKPVNIPRRIIIIRLAFLEIVSCYFSCAEIVLLQMFNKFNDILNESFETKSLYHE